MKQVSEIATKKLPAGRYETEQSVFRTCVLSGISALNMEGRIKIAYRICDSIINDVGFENAGPGTELLRFVTEELEHELSEFKRGRRAGLGDLLSAEGMFTLILTYMIDSIDRMAEGNKEVYRRAGLGAMLE